MSRSTRALLAVAVGSVAVASPGRSQTQYDSAFEQLRSLAPTTAVASVHGLLLRRDVMQLRLDSGVAYVLTPVAGRTVAIAFAGAGSLTFEPPYGIERDNLRRELGDTTING